MSSEATFTSARSGTDNARRLFRANLADALACLGEDSARDKSIHAARKHIKAARTALRLLRDAVPSDTYHYYNDLAADAARPLGAVRDSKALVDTLHALCNGRAKYPASYKQLERVLRREWARGKHHAVAS